MYFFIVLYYFATVFGFIELFSVLDYGLSINDIFLIILSLIFLKDFIWKGKVLETAKNPAIIFFLLQIAFVLVSAAVPILKGDKIQLIQYIKTTSHFLLYTVIVFIAFTYKIENKVWIRIIRIWLISSILINLFGIYQLFARIYDLPFAFFEYNTFSSQLRTADGEGTLKQATLKLENFYRATSIFKEPSGLASFNLTILIFVFFPFIHKLKSFFRNKLLNLFILSLSLVTILLTYSLTAASVIFFLMLGFFLLTGFRFAGKFLLYILIAFIILALSDNYIEKYVDISVMEMFWDRISRLLTTFDPDKYAVAESLPQRMKSASVALSVWATSPIIGVGMGLLAFNTHTDITFADSSFFMVISQMGILGALAFVLMLGVLLFKSYNFAQKYLDADKEDYNTTLNVLMYYLMVYLFIVNIFISNNYVNPYMWSYLAIVYAIINRNYLRDNYPSLKIKFSDIPLIVKFNRNIADYRNSNYQRKNK